MRQEHIYRVNFDEPPISGDPRCDFYFTSLAAIYELFTPEQIGCRAERLWRLGVSKGFIYHSGRCSIVRRPLRRKSQTRRKPRGSK